MFPEQLNVPLGKWVNQFVDWLVINYGAAFEAFADSLLTVLVALEQVLRGAPWWVVLIAIAAITWHASKNWKLATGLVIAMFAIGTLGLWDKAMQTLALMIVATSLSVIIGVPVGIAMAMSNRLRAIMLPVLDTMQTMPSFVYLIPALMLFGLGKVPAILATVIYAAPPVIRLTDLGIRLVDQEVLEASRSFGASRKQILFSASQYHGRDQSNHDDVDFNGRDRIDDWGTWPWRAGSDGHSTFGRWGRHGSRNCDCIAGGCV